MIQQALQVYNIMKCNAKTITGQSHRAEDDNDDNDVWPIENDDNIVDKDVEDDTQQILV